VRTQDDKPERLLKKDVSLPGCDGHAQDKDAKSANSSAIHATEDAVLRRPGRSGGRDFVLQQPAKGGGGRFDVASVLRHAGLFQDLEEKYLLEFASRARRRSLDAGQTLFLAGDRADGLYVVLEGRIKVFKMSPKGREQMLMIMGTGETVGEVAVLSGETYPAGAEALEASEALYIPRQVFLDLLSREPEVAMRLLAALSSRLRAFASLIEDLSLRDVSERLAAHLLSLSTSGAGAETVDLKVSKTQLSAAVGTVPETLSRAFQQLAGAGVLETSGRKVHIKDRALLARLAGVKA
jgi:CRP/FNR family transcriptional regulator, dissimilatory nitrate respiration regulator